MPFLHSPSDLFKFLKTRMVPATEVLVGDIVLQGNQVAYVDEIKRMTPPKEASPEVVEMFTFVEFANEVATYDGYERSITSRIGAEVEIIDRSCLRHLSGDATDEQG
jgi:hypothetical protein